MEKKILKLNLGCFRKKLPGFVNVDIRPDVEPDLVDDVAELKTVEKNTVDLIYSCHVLEHFNREQYPKVLARWYEVLKPGGILRLAVPDMEKSMKHYILYGDLKYLYSMFWGSQRHPYDFHYHGWDFKTLSEDLRSIGFISPRLWDWKTTEPHNYIDDYSQAYFPHMQKETGVLMSLNVEATKPGKLITIQQLGQPDIEVAVE